MNVVIAVAHLDSGYTDYIAIHVVEQVAFEFGFESSFGLVVLRLGS